MVLRCYDHNLNTDRKRRLWIWSGLISVAFYENAAVSILRTAITLTRSTLHLCHKQSRLYFPLAFQTRPRWSMGFVQGVAAGACSLQWGTLQHLLFTSVGRKRAGHTGPGSHFLLRSIKLVYRHANTVGFKWSHLIELFLNDYDFLWALSIYGINMSKARGSAAVCYCLSLCVLWIVNNWHWLLESTMVLQKHLCLSLGLKYFDKQFWCKRLWLVVLHYLSESNKIVVLIRYYFSITYQ